jgi:hypothetical protein
MTDPRFRPVVAIDVEGLLSVIVRSEDGPAPAGYFQQRITVHHDQYPHAVMPQLPWTDDGTWTSTYWFSGMGVAWVKDLLARGIEVWWASTWLEYANHYISPALGFPDLPVAVTAKQWDRICIGDTRPAQLVRQFDKRPLLLVTDMLPTRGRRHLDLLRRPADQALTHLEYIPWNSHVSAADIDTMNKWIENASSSDGQLELRRRHTSTYPKPA